MPAAPRDQMRLAKGKAFGVRGVTSGYKEASLQALVDETTSWPAKIRYRDRQRRREPPTTGDLRNSRRGL